MSMLEIDLQEGFADDAVQITADGQEVFNQTGVSTDYAIGLAKKLQLDLPEKRVQIEVRVSSRRLTGSTEVNTDASGYLGVSVGEGEIVFQVQSEGFIYF